MSQSKTRILLTHKVFHLPTKCTNSWPLNFFNHHYFALNSGVSWGPRNQRNSTVGNSTPVSQGKYFAKNQPGHQLASFEICRISHVCPEPLMAKPGRNLQVRCCSPGPHRPFPPWAASRCVGAHTVLYHVIAFVCIGLSCWLPPQGPC